MTLFLTTESVSGWTTTSNGKREYVTIPFCRQYSIVDFDKDEGAAREFLYNYTKNTFSREPLLESLEGVDAMTFHDSGQNGTWKCDDKHSRGVFISSHPRGKRQKRFDRTKGAVYY